ncbi:MAG: XdhC family protein [Desulfobacterales bacterium]
MPDPELLVFGAGHISTFVAALAKTVGFRVTVIDNRAEWADCRRFPQADAVYVLEFEAAFETLGVSPSAYIVIVTRGHAFDQRVLEQALRTPAACIGMLGSAAKRDKIFTALTAQGFTDQDLGRVHAPIGLPIGAETPAEIAVSIVGELIRVRAGRP